MKYIPIALIALLILGLIWFGVKNRDTKGIQDDEIAALSYESTKYGYAVAYPKGFTYEEKADGNVVFGTRTNGRFEGVAELRVFSIDGTSSAAIAAAVSKEAGAFCASATTADFNCTGASDLESFVTANGTQGYELDFIDATATSSGKSAEKGPFFFIPLGAGATAKTMVMVHPPLNLSRANTDASVVRDIAQSVRTLPSAVSAESVEEHVSAIISDLSNEAGKPATLGGTFYVTAVDANDGKGTVSYEDGHEAYTADFTYSIDANGRISMKSFTVR